MRKVNIGVPAGALLAVLAVIMTLVIIGNSDKTVSVFVANRYIAATKQITLADVSKVSLRPADVPPGSLNNINEIVGRYALSPIYTDQTFIAQSLATTSNEQAVVTSGLQPNDRAFAVQADVAQALAGRIQTGDYVDIVAVVNASGVPAQSSSGSTSASTPIAGQFSETLIQHAYVIDIDLPASAIESQANNTSTVNNPSQVAGGRITVPGIYILALTTSQVQEVALAENIGTLYLSLDPVGNFTPATGQPTDPQQLQSSGIGPCVQTAGIVCNGASATNATSGAAG